MPAAAVPPLGRPQTKRQERGDEGDDEAAGEEIPRASEAVRREGGFEAASARAERALGVLRAAEAEMAGAAARAEALAREAAVARAQEETLREHVREAREASQAAQADAEARAARLAPDAAEDAQGEVGDEEADQAAVPPPAVNGSAPDDSGWREELRLWHPEDRNGAASHPAPGAGGAAASAPAAAGAGRTVEFVLKTPSAGGAGRSALSVTVGLGGAPCVEFSSDAAEDLTLHWSIADKPGGRWKRVPRGWKTLPDFSIDAGGNAWETAFMQVPRGLRERSQDAGAEAVQTVRLEFSDLSELGGVVFVLKVGDSGSFLNNGGGDFFVPVTADFS